MSDDRDWIGELREWCCVGYLAPPEAQRRIDILISLAVDMAVEIKELSK